ncbi:MAG TPA: NAD(P)H-hydrate dehydratase [Tepidisphaeraceae bacterium]|jgi:NAD(P)H-hydrate epimerase
MDLERVDRPAALPPRPHDANKGTFGRVVIVGGNDEMIGAPVLAGMAALRMGAGLVQVAMPQSVLPAALSVCPELIGMGLEVPKDNERLTEAAQKADALVVGPGLGTSDRARERFESLVSLDKPMVVDADGLNILASMKHWPAATFKAKAVLTPHPGEMRRLAALLPPDEAGTWMGAGPIPSDERSRIDVAAAAARAFGQVMVLKGHRTIVTDGRRLYINTTGDSTLSKAGTGDILSGVLGALLGQRMDDFDAATLATWLHGKAGEIAGATYGRRSALGREVIDCLAQAIGERESEQGG